MPKYIAAIDQGTTSTRCLLFDRTSVVAASQVEHAQLLPQPGWVEHDPIEIWEKTQSVVRDALSRAGCTGREIAAVGVTNQRETTVVWNRRTGKPYCNAIVWQDTRTQSICDEMARDGGADRFRAVTGLPLATYFSAGKLRWVLDHVPGVRQAAVAGDALFGTIDTWLIWNLTGGQKHVTDVSNASRTLLMNLSTLDWDDTLLGAFDIPRAMLPSICPSSGTSRFGSTRADGCFGADVPISGCIGDQQAALFGQTSFDPGESKNTYGTGCFVLLNTGNKLVRSTHGLLTTLAYQLADQAPVYALEGSVAIAGALVQWFRDQLGIIQSSGQIDELARTVSDNGGAYIVPAFSGLFAPYWRPDARGTICGLTHFTSRAHLARAVIEATALQTHDVVDAMTRDSGVPLRSLKVDGGMTASGVLMQFQSDILNVPVVRPRIAETTALGAAYAAGLAVGFWNGLDELRVNWQESARWNPGMDPAARTVHIAKWKKAVERSLGWE